MHFTGKTRAGVPAQLDAHQAQGNPCAPNSNFCICSFHPEKRSQWTCREDARWAYLHEMLIRRRGHPATVAILYAEVMRLLLGAGAVDFAVAMDTK